MALTPRLSAYDGVLLDLDGCLWVGDEAIEGAPEAVAALRAAGKRLAFITNNTRRSPDEYVRKLWRLGFQASAEEVVTAGTATRLYLAGRGGGAAFVIGPQALVDQVALAGMRVVNGTDLATRADVVVVAGHERFDYAELRTGMHAVLRGAQIVGTARDPTYPMPDGPWPGSGAVLAALETATGRTADVVTGKPEAPMYEAARAVTGDGRLLGVTSRLEAARADPAPTHLAPSLASLVLG